MEPLAAEPATGPEEAAIEDTRVMGSPTRVDGARSFGKQLRHRQEWTASGHTAWEAGLGHEVTPVG
jgi:hypothetical protein